MIKMRLLCVASLVIALAGVRVADAFELKDGDSVVFIGDTLTMATGYTNLLEGFVRVRYPDLDLRFFNTGWNREIAAEGNDRLERDVLSLEPTPTIAVIGYGTYDGAMQAFDELRFKEFEKSMDEMISRLKAVNCRIWLLTPMSVDEELNNRLMDIGYNGVLEKYVEGIRVLGEKHDAKVVDLYNTSIEGRVRHREFDNKFTYTTDGSRPKYIQGVFIATEVLKAWEAEPLAIDLKVDWEAKTATLSAGQVETESRSDTEMLLTLSDLPILWPRVIPEKERAGQMYWPMSELSRMVLRVENCPEPGLIMGNPQKGTPVLKVQIEADGIDLARYEPVRSHDAMVKFAQLVVHKNRIRTNNLWLGVLLKRTEQPELVEAQNLQIKSLEAYVLGYRDWIGNMPQTFDVTLRLTALTPELLQAAKGGGKRKSPINRQKVPVNRGKLGGFSPDKRAPGTPLGAGRAKKTEPAEQPKKEE